MSDPTNPKQIPTPIADALREHLKKPVDAEKFAADMNAFAGGLSALSEIKKEAKSEAEQKVAEATPGVLNFNDFVKVDLRIGTIKEAEKVPKSDKLLRLQVDLGEDKPRQIVAGIGKSFTPEQLIGQQVTVVANLAPRKLMGVESHGMILAAGETEDLALLQPTKARNAGRKVS